MEKTIPRCRTIPKYNCIFTYFLLLILYMVEICTNYQKIILKWFVLSVSLTWKDYLYLHTRGRVYNSSEIHKKKHIILELNREILITTATFCEIAESNTENNAYQFHPWSYEGIPLVRWTQLKSEPYCSVVVFDESAIRYSLCPARFPGSYSSPQSNMLHRYVNYFAFTIILL